MRQRHKARHNPTIAAIIAAGGMGTRMSAAVPKQFLELAGKPILLHTIERVLELREVQQVVVALPRRHIQRARALLGGLPLKVPVKCVSGGSSRQESVRRAVAHALQSAEIILVHDAVRPLCDRETMERVVQAAWRNGSAVPGLPVTETIHRVSPGGRVLSTPARSDLYAIQTPQGFRADILRSALEDAHAEGFCGTDESSVVRWAGGAVSVVPGSSANIKITSPLDLEIAELLSGRDRKNRKLEDHTAGAMMFRIGHGIDYHRLAEGRRLVLGGVEVPFKKGLEGHSDADALVHAICDSLLGAAALGDIGRHFPDSDPSNRNRSSLEFLHAVRTMIEASGWVIRNVDATLLAQSPRLEPFMGAMTINISKCLGLEPAAVNIKATTTEGMNAEGRGEGISAHAIALLEKQGRSTP